MRGIWSIAGMLFTATGFVFAQSGVERGGTLPGPLPLLPSDNWWNVKVDQAPLESDGNRFITWIGESVSVHPDWGGDTGATPPDALMYGMPYIVVPGSLALEQVSFYYADESDSGRPGVPGYPIPVEARTQPLWIEGGIAGGGTDGDRHLLIVDRDNRYLFELYALNWNSTDSRWEAGSGAVYSLDSNTRRPDGWTSADAAGLAILPGLVRYDEVYGSDPIRHAFRFTVRATNGYVYPASHTAGSSSSAPPMGTRFRLKASKDISSYSAPMQKILQALKDYGLIVADNGSDMYITGTYDNRWDMDLFVPAFRTVYAGDFEVVQLGWQPGVTPPPTTATVDLSGSWLKVREKCRRSRTGMSCTLRGKLQLQTTGGIAPESQIAVYVSDTDTLSANAVPAAQFTTGRFRKAGQKRTKSFAVRLPAGTSASGKYVIARLDAGNSVEEVNEANNTLVFGPITSP